MKSERKTASILAQKSVKSKQPANEAALTTLQEHQPGVKLTLGSKWMQKEQ